jgi:hypothetical protein
MKKIVKLLCVVLLLSSTAIAQQAQKTVPATAPNVEARSKPRPPRLIRTPLPPLLFTAITEEGVTPVGTCDAGVVLESAKGERLLLTTENELVALEKSKRWTPIVPRPTTVLKLKGGTDSGTLVWEDNNGKGCTVNKTSAKTEEVTIAEKITFPPNVFTKTETSK